MKHPSMEEILILFTIFASVTTGNLLNIEEIEFSVRQQNETYKSLSKYDGSVMDPFYKAINVLLDSIVGDNLIPEGYMKIVDGQITEGPNVKEKNWNSLLKTYWGVLIIILLTLIFVIVLPVVGLYYCRSHCKRISGNQHKKRRIVKKKYSYCLICCKIIVIVLTIILCVSVGISIKTNYTVEKNINGLTETGRNSSDDVRTFLHKSSDKITHLFNQNYNELSNYFQNIFKDTGNIIRNQLKEKLSIEISLRKLNGFVQNLPKMNSDLKSMKNFTNELMTIASKLTNKFDEIEQDLVVELGQCSGRITNCKILLDDIHNLNRMENNFKKLPSKMIVEISNDVQLLLESDLLSSVTKTVDLFTNLQMQINKTITKHISNVEISMDHVGANLNKMSAQIISPLIKLKHSIGNNTNKYLDKTDHYIKEFNVYRFYSELGVSLILLLILVLIVIGLSCGMFDYQQNKYEISKYEISKFQYNYAENNCLILAVILIFITMSFVAIVTLIHFLIGFIAYRGVCVPLRNTKHKLFQYVDNSIDLNYIYQDSFSNSILGQKPVLISDLIESCHQRKPIFEALHLENSVKYKELLNSYQKYNENELEELFKNLKLQQSELTPDIESAINLLVSSKLKIFNTTKFINYLGKDVTNYNLPNMIEKLNSIIDELSSHHDMLVHQDITEHKELFEQQTLQLNVYEVKIGGG